LRKLFTQLAQPAGLHRAKPRWQGVIDDSGAELVEFALSFSVLVGLLFGIIFACLALYTRHFVCQAALEGARWAMVRGSASCTDTPNLTDCNATQAEIQTYVQGLSFPGVNSQSLTVTTTWCSASASTPRTWTGCASGTSNAPGNAVQVQVSYPFPFSIPSVKMKSLTLSTSTLTFSSTSQLVISQ
jgi:Flp pilus assembly protein TadG